MENVTDNQPNYIYKYIVDGQEFWTPSLLLASARSQGNITEVQVG